jgi:acyl carrier protein
VGGTGVARGYAGHPELTAERFLPDPYGPPAARVYRTGDLVRVLPDGNVDFIGRLDGQVKIRGHRVEVAEIQAVLAEHPAVRDAVVVLAGDGHERVRLAAYCVPATADPARESLPEELAAHCAARLPDYMVPATVQLIGALPLNANGKLDRVALARLSDAPADEDIVKPEGFVEERIAEIFTSLLGRPVGADTHFFHVGGNSILAVRLVAAIQSSFEVTLPIRAVFEGPTVAELARRVQAVIRAEIAQMPEAELIAQTQRYRTAEQSACEQA